MKKKYIAPLVFCESFQLSQHVASCGLNMQSENETTCKGMITDDMVTKDPSLEGSSGMTLFTAAIACQIKNEDYCYTNSTAGQGVFFGS